MPREQFFYGETQPLFNQLEELSRRSGVSRGQAFEDWLTAVVCALAAETKEDEYLAMIKRHTKGERGKRGCDLMAQMLAELAFAMESSDADILGDLFQASISYQESGQFLSPESVARLLAEMSIDPDAKPTADHPLLVNDPCCGTGRMLLEAAKVNPHVELVGQDIDARCAKITAVNLGLRGRYGWVVCGNSLSAELHFAYRIGSFFHESPNGPRRGVIRDVAPEQTPVPVSQQCIRRDAGELFAHRDRSKSRPEARLPTIIEVPRWLARLEPQVAALRRDDETTDSTDGGQSGTPSRGETSATEPPTDRTGNSQLELF